MKNSRNRLMLGVFFGLCFCVCATLMSSPLAAQSTFGSVTGTVVDATGAAVPGVAVTLTNSGTAQTQVVTTGADGLYTFVNLNPGEYRIDAEKTSFKHFKREHIVIEVQQSARIDVTMEVGAVNQTVEVTGETPLLQTTTTSLGQVIDETQVDQIPLNGRNVFNLISLAPSVIAQGGSGGTPVGQNPFSWGNYQVGGSFGNESAEYLDGQPLNIGYINLPILIPDQDSISEFKVQYNNLGPEWGKFAGGIINLSTKGGSNDYHGEAYEYLRNKVLNSRGYFLNAVGKSRPPWVQNQFGANVGGPLNIPRLTGRSKTFWFFSGEGFRLRTGQPFTATVPDAKEAAGNFSEVCK